MLGHVPVCRSGSQHGVTCTVLTMLPWLQHTIYAAVLVMEFRLCGLSRINGGSRFSRCFRTDVGLVLAVSGTP